MGARMLRDQLHRQGVKAGRRHIGTLMLRMGITALAPQPGTSKRAPKRFKGFHCCVAAASFNRIDSPTGYIVNEMRSCGSDPSSVYTSAISKLASSIAITILISASAR